MPKYDLSLIEVGATNGYLSADVGAFLQRYWHPGVTGIAKRERKKGGIKQTIWCFPLLGAEVTSLLKEPFSEAGAAELRKRIGKGLIELLEQKEATS